MTTIQMGWNLPPEERGVQLEGRPSVEFLPYSQGGWPMLTMAINTTVLFFFKHLFSLLFFLQFDNNFYFSAQYFAAEQLFLFYVMVCKILFSNHCKDFRTENLNLLNENNYKRWWVVLTWQNSSQRTSPSQGSSIYYLSEQFDKYETVAAKRVV